MNKEVIKKYKDVFDWWLDGGKVWMKTTVCNQWFIQHDKDMMWGTNATYVQDDQYAELRKALEDGKVIQYNPLMSCHDRWDDIPRECKLSPTRCDTIKNYRIKPTEPNFSVGDWVRHPDDYIFKTCADFAKDCHNMVLPPRFELWKPQEGELAIMWNDDQDSYRIAKFKQIAHGKPRVGQYKDMQGNYFDNIAPLEFIQTLKDR